MNFDSKKNTIPVLAAILIVGFGIMALTLVRGRAPFVPDLYDNEIKKIETLSEFDTIESIENDLENTDLENIDKELQDIERELDSVM